MSNCRQKRTRKIILICAVFLLLDVFSTFLLFWGFRISTPYDNDEYSYVTGTVTNVSSARTHWRGHRKLYVVFEMGGQDYRVSWNWRLPSYKDVIEQMQSDEGPYTIAIVKRSILRRSVFPSDYESVIDVRSPSRTYVDIGVMNQDREARRPALYISALIFGVPLLLAHWFCGGYLINDYATWGKGKFAKFLRRKKKAM